MRHSRELNAAASEDLCREVFDIFEDPLFLCDAETGSIIVANRTAAERTGYSLDELRGLRFSTLSSGTPPYSSDDANTWLARGLNNGPQAFHWRGRQKNGSLFWVEVHLKPATIGGTAGILIAFRDVTGQKQSENIAIAILNATAALSGQAFFNAAAEQIGVALHADYAFISEAQSSGRARILALSSTHELGATTEYDLGATPCQTVLQRGLCSYPSNVQGSFPQDQLLVEWKAEGYIGARLVDSSEHAIGLIGLVYRTPIAQPAPIESTLLILEDRIAAELERQRSQQQLEQEQTFSQQAINSMPGAFYLVDVRGRFLRWNAYLEQLTGYSRDEVRRMQQPELFAQEDRNRIMRTMAEVMMAGQASLDARFITKNGQHIPCVLTARRAMLGLTPCVIGLAIVMADHRRMEGALRQSEPQYRSLIENIAEAIFSTDADGKFTFVSPSVEHIIGYRPDELTGRQLTQFVLPADVPAVSESYRRIAAGSSESIEFRVITRSGEHRWVHTSTSPQYDRQSFVGLTGVATDIHQRKMAEEALIESERKFRAIVEANPMGMHMYRLEPDGRLVFVGANPAADRILGVPNEQFIGKSIEEAFPPLAATEIPGRYRDVAAGKGPWTTNQVVYKDNQIAGAFEVHAFQTAPDRMVAAFLDITERKKTEASLEHRRAFEHLITAISTRFIGLPTFSLSRGMERALEEVGNFANADRGYVLLFSDDHATVSCAAEWARNGFTRQMEQTQLVPAESLSWWIDGLAHGTLRVRHSPADLPDEQAFARELFSRLGIDSVVEFPLPSGGRVRGVLGIAVCGRTCEWPQDHLTLLCIIGQIFANALDRQSYEEALRASEQRLELALKGAELGLWDWHIPSNTIIHNEQWAEMLGFSLKDIKPHFSTWETLVHPDDKPHVLGTLQAHLNGQRPLYEAEFRLRSHTGEWRWILDRGRIVQRNADGTPLRMAGTHLDITDRKQAEEKLLASLHEKNVLLKEIHHRVKNNLQVISSLLSLQSQNVRDQHVLDALRESHNRVRSMAIVHQQLYQSENFAEIVLSQYVQNLARTLFRSFEIDPERISLSIEADNVRLGIDSAIPCGLIINELITNALKHAFPGRKKGSIKVGMFHEGLHHLNLIVADDGVGLPPDHDTLSVSTLGLQLVSTLVQQLDGTMSLSGHNGTTAAICFRPA